ncbi:MAG: hypothetical protein HGB10_04995 [Coriobacteriia bacterium]|nr:hypothetical protein [Coriobacteriia bacterium]
MGTLGRRQTLVAVVVGLVWAQACAAVALLVLPRYLILAERIALGTWFRLAAWTVGLPLSLGGSISSGRVLGAAEGTVGWEPLVLSSLVAVTVCVSAAQLLASSDRCRVAASAVIATALLAGGAGSVMVAHALWDGQRAEAVFFDLLGRQGAPQRDPSVVASARDFASRYPDSRWASEALRIQAVAASERGSTAEEVELWERFSACFRNRAAPGVAIAEYNLGRCARRIGSRAVAAEHFAAALALIDRRDDGVQSWIATASLAGLRDLARERGRHALASRWDEEFRRASRAEAIER